MKIEINEIEWDEGHDHLALPEKIILNLRDLHLEDVTEENSSFLANWIAEKYGWGIETFQYKTLDK